MVASPLYFAHMQSLPKSENCLAIFRIACIFRNTDYILIPLHHVQVRFFEHSIQAQSNIYMIIQTPQEASRFQRTHTHHTTYLHKKAASLQMYSRLFSTSPFCTRVQHMLAHSNFIRPSASIAIRIAFMEAQLHTKIVEQTIKTSTWNFSLSPYNQRKSFETNHLSLSHSKRPFDLKLLMYCLRHY